MSIDDDELVDDTDEPDELLYEVRRWLMLAPWRTQAACRGLDPERFFPARGVSADNARAVCVTCPVRADCLDAAMIGHENYGIWGGYSERQRRALRRANRLGGAA